MDKIRIGTRGSKLALKQAALVQEALSCACGDIVTELVILRTRGDQIQDSPLSELGDKGVFASELERALLAGQIDLAVHSAKDLPMRLADGLVIAAVLPRADVRDVLVVPKGGRMPGDGASVFRLGTGSRRRQFLAGKVWENVICEEIRGNVDTRLKKLREGSYDGIILAKAGLDRLGTASDWEEAFDFYPLSPEVFLPAACQGIIAVEAVEGSAAAELCKGISDAETALCYAAEREALVQLSADCSETAAAWCRIVKDGGIRKEVLTADEDFRDEERTFAKKEPETEKAADRLLMDVMYADRRVKVTGLVSEAEGIRLARCAAQSVKSRQDKTACDEADNVKQK